MSTAPVKLAVVSAGLSEPSSTRLLADRLAAAASRGLETAGREPQVQHVELRDLATEIAQNFVTGFAGGELKQALDDVSEADGLIAVTPVFSASYSGLFKSFFDVMENTALTGKPVLMGATGGTPRHSLVLDHALRPLFSYLRAVAVPTAVYAATDDWGSADDGLTPSLPGRIERAGAELARLAQACSPAVAVAEPEATAEDEEAVGEQAPHLKVVAQAPSGDPYEDVVPFAQQLAALRPEE